MIQPIFLLFLLIPHHLADEPAKRIPIWERGTASSRAKRVENVVPTQSGKTTGNTAMMPTKTAPKVAQKGGGPPIRGMTAYLRRMGKLAPEESKGGEGGAGQRGTERRMGMEERGRQIDGRRPPPSSQSRNPPPPSARQNLPVPRRSGDPGELLPKSRPPNPTTTRRSAIERGTANQTRPTAARRDPALNGGEKRRQMVVKKGEPEKTPLGPSAIKPTIVVAGRSQKNIIGPSTRPKAVGPLRQDEAKLVEGKKPLGRNNKENVPPPKSVAREREKLGKNGNGRGAISNGQTVKRGGGGEGGKGIPLEGANTILEKTGGMEEEDDLMPVLEEEQVPLDGMGKEMEMGGGMHGNALKMGSSAEMQGQFMAMLDGSRAADWGDGPPLESGPILVSEGRAGENGEKGGEKGEGGEEAMMMDGHHQIGEGGRMGKNDGGGQEGGGKLAEEDEGAKGRGKLMGKKGGRVGQIVPEAKKTEQEQQKGGRRRENKGAGQMSLVAKSNKTGPEMNDDDGDEEEDDEWESATSIDIIDGGAKLPQNVHTAKWDEAKEALAKLEAYLGGTVRMAGDPAELGALIGQLVAVVKAQRVAAVAQLAIQCLAHLARGLRTDAFPQVEGTMDASAVVAAVVDKAKEPKLAKNVPEECVRNIFTYTIDANKSPDTFAAMLEVGFEHAKSPGQKEMWATFLDKFLAKWRGRMADEGLRKLMAKMLAKYAMESRNETLRDVGISALGTMMRLVGGEARLRKLLEAVGKEMKEAAELVGQKNAKKMEKIIAKGNELMAASAKEGKIDEEKDGGGQKGSKRGGGGGGRGGGQNGKWGGGGMAVKSAAAGGKNNRAILA